MRTIKEEEVDLSEYADVHGASQSIGRFVEDVYTTYKRIRSALGYLTRAEFKAQWAAHQPRPTAKISKDISVSNFSGISTG